MSFTRSATIRRLFREIAVPLSLLIAADIAFRFVARSPAVPLPNMLNSPVGSGKYLAYRHLADEDQPLQILLMGQSQMLRASAGIVRETIERETGRQIIGFNFAAPMQSVEFDRRLLEDVLVPIKPPRLVVLGLLPQNLVFEQPAHEVDELTRSLPAFAMHAGTPEARVEDLLFRYSALFRYRSVIHDTLLRAPPQPPFWVTLSHNIDGSGDISIGAPVRPVYQLTAWDLQFVPKFRQFDGLMTTSQLFEHIGDLARTCRAHGIQLVVVNNAMHPLALQELPNGQNDLTRFIAAVHATADAEGVPVLDSAPGGIGPAEMFADGAHPNVAGTRWMSEQIGHFLVERDLLDRPLPSTPMPIADLK